MRLLCPAALLAVAVSVPGAIPRLHTPDDRHSLDTIRVTAVYFLPKDRAPLPDWHDRIAYFMRRIEAFHRRELSGESTLRTRIYPAPLRSMKTPAELRAGDQNSIFWATVNEARAGLGWPGDDRDGFPILLLLSDINWRELDDFRRVRVVDGLEQHEGYVAPNGRHFPGAESGGSRAVYLADEGLGMGLVTADGWRAPYSGSDCVVYHEGVGHAIGLPHPQPMDDSVMGRAQYRFWINETWIADTQKKALGWSPGARVGDPRLDLFTTFRALPRPLVPRPGEPIALQLSWPAGARARRLELRVQTALFGPWHNVPVDARGIAPDAVDIGIFDRETPVSYRVNVTLEDGQSAEVWGYFTVGPSPGSVGGGDRAGLSAIAPG